MQFDQLFTQSTKWNLYSFLSMLILFYQFTLYTKSACILVHGTWATNEKWYRPSGDFFEAIQACNQELNLVDAYYQATSHNAADFLKKVLLFFPFKIHSIQVDGGSEFMAEFEDMCQKLSIDLFVLPPKSPKLNGCVERSNHTLHYEFYVIHERFKDLKALRQKSSQFVDFYNTKRPHQHLNYYTPMTYYLYRKENQKPSVSYV